MSVEMPEIKIVRHVRARKLRLVLSLRLYDLLCRYFVVRNKFSSF